MEQQSRWLHKRTNTKMDLMLCILLFIFTDSCLCKSLSVLQVPHNAKPGFVVTVLPSHSHIAQVSSLDTGHAISTDMLTAHNQLLILSQNISHLKGQSLKVAILSPRENLELRLLVSDSCHPFVGGPFNGRVYHSSPAGTEVLGLGPFSDAIRNNHLIHVQIDQGRTDLFKLEPAEEGYHLRTKESLYMQHGEKYNLVISAVYPEQSLKVYANLDIFIVKNKEGLQGVLQDSEAHKQSHNNIIFEEEHMKNEQEFKVDTHLRKKRQALQRTFVVPHNKTGNLFTLKMNTNEKVYPKDPFPSQLQLDSDTGMVSRSPGAVLPLGRIQFDVTINRTDSAAQQDLQVTMQVVERGIYSPVFKNEPQPLIIVVQEWMYPRTEIFIFQAVDTDMGAEVEYKLESGADERFKLDPTSGVLSTLGRLPFQQNFSLAVSADNVGAVRDNLPFTQQVTVVSTDRGPQFYQDPYVLKMPENQPVGDYYQIQVKSFFDLSITYSMEQEYQDPAREGYFSIDSQSGYIRLLKAMDYESLDPRHFRFIVTAREAHSNFVTKCLVIIHLEDVNDQIPFFAPKMYMVRDVREDLAVGNPVGSPALQVTATDTDSGDNGKMTFNVSDPHFRAVSADGKIARIEVNSALDYDDLKDRYYEFEVYATDGGQPANTGTGTVRVWMQNVNDNDPELVPSTQNVILSEEATTQTVVHVVQAFDRDGDKITFSSLSTSPTTDLFRLDQTTGHIMLTRKFNKASDPDRFTATVTVSDDNSCCPGMGGSSRQGTGTVNIELTGVNRPPRFENCQDYTGRAIIPEQEPANTTVINVMATDNDPGKNGDLTYSMVFKHTETPRFNIRTLPGKQGGDVYSLEMFDRENPEGITKIGVTVQATDGGTPQLSAFCFFYIEIGDINDNKPIFDEASYDFTIAGDHLLNSKVLQVFAVDDDLGNNATVDYSIENQMNNCSGQPCFSIPDSRDGWIMLTNSFTGDLPKVVQLTVKATDQGTPTQLSSTATAKIEVVEKNTGILPPRWNEEYESKNITFRENTAVNTVIQSVRATSQSAEAEKVTYSDVILGRTKMENSKEDFRKSDNTSSGTNFIDVFIYKNLDYEDTKEYSLKVRASNRRTGEANKHNIARLKVHLTDVNDNIPRFVGTDQNGVYPAFVSEDSAVGTTVVFVSAVDDDGTSPNNKVSYEFDGTDGAYSSFQLNQDSGLITTNRVFGKELIGQEYFLQVVAKDGAPSARNPSGLPNSATATVGVQITGLSVNPPYFTSNTTTFSFVEDQVFDTEVGSVTALNPKPELVSLKQYGILAGNENQAFGVDMQSGRIFSMNRALYQTKQEYRLDYRAFDGYQEAKSTVVINIQSRNRRPPRFSQVSYTTTVSFPEESAPQSPQDLTTVDATDPDAPSRCTSDNILYQLAGPLYLRTSSAFDMNNKIVRRLQALDRDYPKGHATWVLNVEGRDEQAPCTVQEGRDGYTQVIIRPTDINDNKPLFDKCCIIGSVAEGVGSGREVMQLTAEDYDENQNAQVTYMDLVQLQPPTPTPLFTVSPTGRITTTNNANLDRETLDTYLVNVTVRDNGTPQQTNYQTIQINIADVNDHPPQYQGSKSYAKSIPEEMPLGAYVLDVFATDEDIVENAYRDYSIVGAEGNSFAVENIRSTGAGSLKIKERIDYENMPNKVLRFQVRVQHPTETPHQDIADVTITVTDINDHTPAFNQQVINVTVSEGENIGYQVTTVTATDGDGTSPNNQFEPNIRYSIDYENTDPGKKFQVAADGKVTLRNKLDRETEAYHTVHVLATDKGTPALTGTATLYVTVGDINDNAPDFRVTYDFRVKQQTNPNTEIGRVQASDADLPINGPPFTFELDPSCQGNTECPFAMQFVPDPGDNAQAVIRTVSGGFIRTPAQRHFNVPIIMKDNPTSGASSMQAKRNLKVIIEGGNMNNQKPGYKEVTVYNYRGRLGRVEIGNVYAEDQDDWDRGDKDFNKQEGLDCAQYFDVDKNGTLYMNGAPRGQCIITATVFDRVRGVSATAEVLVNNIWIQDDAVYNSGSMRLSGTTDERFIERPKSGDGVKDYGTSALDKFKTQLALLLGTEEGNVHVFAVRNVEGKENMVDVRFAAHGSPYYRTAKLDGLVWSNKAQVEQAMEGGITITMAPIDDCRDKVCWNKGCYNEYKVDYMPKLVNTNATSLVGVNAYTEASCICGVREVVKQPSCDPNPCKNNGTCNPSVQGGFTCTCPEGYHGARCQMTHASFQGSGWGWVEPFQQCEDQVTSIEFITGETNGLLLYVGPMYAPGGATPWQYLTLELVGGYPQLRVNSGAGELKLQLDGMDSNNQRQLNPLNDGQWHLVEIIKTKMMYEMVVDMCRVSTIDEDIERSVEDRKACAVSGTVPGDSFLITVSTPVQVGGRSVSFSLPSGGLQGGFNGCIKNLKHNGELADLNMEPMQSSNAEVGCPREAAVCADKCPGNSTCTGSFGDTYSCRCLPGFSGQNCDQEISDIFNGDSSARRRKRQTQTDTPDWNYMKDSFIQWKLKDPFFQRLSDRSDRISITYRTRRTEGMLFTASSTTRMEHVKIEIVNSNLQVRYDLGADDHIVKLDNVNASDGQWHTVTVVRQANQVFLSMDSGDAPYYAQSPQSDNFRIIKLSQTELFGGADVKFHKYSGAPQLSHDYFDSCMADVRYDEQLFPWERIQNLDAAEVTTSENLQASCLSDACAGVSCTYPTTCQDLWRHAICVCPANMTVAPPPDVCVDVLDCSIDQCVHGDCVTVGGRFKCHCYVDWTGERCDEPILVAPVLYAGLTTGGIVSIVVCLLALLLLILLVVLILRNRRKDPLLIDELDNDIRDNVVYYDEEGAGEEDYHGYDLTSLRKPVRPDETDSITGVPMGPKRVDQMPLEMSAAPMGAKRPPYGPDGQIPSNIGDFIGDRLNDADNDPNVPPFDSVREFEDEGAGSSVGSLSSLATSSSGDLDFDYLNDYGPKFRKLADMYGGGDNEDESNV